MRDFLSSNNQAMNSSFSSVSNSTLISTLSTFEGIKLLMNRVCCVLIVAAGKFYVSGSLTDEI